MPAGSILPIAIHNNQLFFLFGKENSMEDSHKGFSDFGGGAENDETPYETALREGAEETSFFFGDKNDVEKMIKKSGGFFKVIHDTYHAHLFLIEYDENLPKYYNNNHRHLWNKMDKQVLNQSKFFEKIEMRWFSVRELTTKRKLFRHFYKEIVDQIKEQLPEIRRFMEAKHKTKKNKTRKNI